MRQGSFGTFGAEALDRARRFWRAYDTTSDGQGESWCCRGVKIASIWCNDTARH